MTEDVFNHHLQAFGIGIDEIMKDYTDESVIITHDATHRGRDAIRAFFQDFFDTFPAEAWDDFALLKTEVVGEVAYLTWKASPYTDLGTDTFLIRDGKIAVQTYTKS